MSFYGLRLFDYDGKKYAYGVYKRLTPANQSYSVATTLVDYIFVANDSSLTLTNTDTQANVSVTRENNLVDVSSFQGSNCVIQSGNADVESISVFTRKPDGNVSTFQNVELVNIESSYELLAGKAALIVEGTLSVPVGETNFDANSQVDIYSVGPRLTNTTLTGTGKVIVFNIT